MIVMSASNNEYSYIQLIFPEVTVIRKMAPIKLILHPPETEEGKEVLARRVSDAHTTVVIQRLNSLNCPMNQKLALMDAIITTIKADAGKVHP